MNSPDGNSVWGGRRRVALMLAPVLVSATTIVLLMSVVNWESRQMLTMTQRLTTEGLLLLTILFGLQQVGRAARLRTLLSEPPPLRRLAEIVLIHQLCDYLLPLKTGELSLPELLKLEGIERPVSFAMLFVMRGCDLLLATILLLAAVLLFHHELPEAWPYMLPLAIGVSAILSLLAIALRWFSRRGHRLRELPRCHPNGSGGVPGDRKPSRTMREHEGGSHVEQGFQFRWLGHKFNMFSEALASLSWKQLWQVVLVTFEISVVGIAFNLFFCWQLAPELRWQSALLVVLTMPLASQFPLRGWAGLGTSEACLVLLFCLAGMDASAAFSLAVCGRVFHFALLSSSGVVAFGLYLREHRGVFFGGGTFLKPHAPTTNVIRR